MRLIDAIPLVQEAQRFRGVFKTDLEKYVADMFIRMLDFAPAVDAVPVVRCCRCTYSWFRLSEPHSRYCKHTGLNVDDNDFCSYGERKTE